MRMVAFGVISTSSIARPPRGDHFGRAAGRRLAQSNGGESRERNAVGVGVLVEVFGGQSRVDQQCGDGSIGSIGVVGRDQTRGKRAHDRLAATHGDAIASRHDARRRVGDGASKKRGGLARKFDFQRQPRGHLVAERCADRANRLISERFHHRAASGAAQHEPVAGRIFAHAHQSSVQAQQHAHRVGGGKFYLCGLCVECGQRVGVEPRACGEKPVERGVLVGGRSRSEWFGNWFGKWFGQWFSRGFR